MKKRIKGILLLCITAVFLIMTAAYAENIEAEFGFSFENVKNGQIIEDGDSSVNAVLNESAVLTTGISGNGVFVDGKGADLKITYSAAEAEEAAYAVWFKPKTTGLQYGTGAVISDDGRVELSYNYQTNKLKLCITTEDDTVELMPEYTFSNDRWYQAVICYDGSEVKLYVNKNLAAQEQLSGMLAEGTGMHFGTDGQNHFRGCIDEISFYGQALDEMQIIDMYNSVIGKAAAADTADFPFASVYKNGITAAASELFRTGGIVAPIETGFENREEIFSAYTDDFGGQLSISESRYSGKFALQIHQKSNRIIPIRESEYFHIDKVRAKENPVNIYAEDKKIVIDVKAKPYSNVTAKIYRDGQYLQEQIAAVSNANGEAELRSGKLDCRAYNVRLEYYPDSSSVNTIEMLYEITVSDSNLYLQAEVVSADTIKLKSNRVRMMIKPMEKAETISFYTKAQIMDAAGGIRETYVLLKSDADGDGIYRVGEELARGKWQEITIDLQDIDEEIINLAVSGIYASANIDSVWLFDDIKAEYIKRNERRADLSAFICDNIVYDNRLRFAKINKTETVYDNKAAVAAGTVQVSGKIAGFNIEDGVSGLLEQAETEEKTEILYTADFASDDCIVYENGYDDEFTGESKKGLSVYNREEQPVMPQEKSTVIKIDKEKESRFRFVFRGYSSITITDSNGNAKTYSASSDKNQYSDWYEDDITISISSSSSYYLSDRITYCMIQYETTDETRNDLLMSEQSVAKINLNGLETEKRIRLELEFNSVFEAPTYASQPVILSFYEADYETPYYTVTRRIGKTTRDSQSISLITSRIRPDTILEIRNLTDEYPQYFEDIRITELRIKTIQDSDWDLSSVYTNQRLGQATYFTDVELSDVIPDEEKYALESVNATATATASGSLSVGSNRDYIVRYVNLAGDNRINDKELNYGEGFMIASSGSSGVITVRGNGIYIISVTAISQSDYTESNIPIFVKGLDGVREIYELSSDTNAVYYANMLDHQYLYKYSFDTKEYKKLLEEKVLEIAVSPDETLCAVRTSDGAKLINLTNGDLQDIESNRGLMFNARNELYSTFPADAYSTGSVLKQYLDGEVITIADMSSYKNYDFQYAFDSTGKYLVCIYGRSVNLFEQYNGTWTKKKSFSINDNYSDSYPIRLSDDISTIYVDSGYIIDINSETITHNTNGYIKYNNGDTCIVYYYNAYYLYIPSTGERYKIFNNTTPEYKFIAYNPDSNIITYTTDSGGFVRVFYDSKRADIKYLMSFDGRNTWNAYKNGRWLQVSGNSLPTASELAGSGMTASEVNSIKQTAINKLYTDNTDILTVDFAVYMTSASNRITPYIDYIGVLMQDSAQDSNVYSVNIEKFNKSDYKTVESMFPIENFDHSAECYYLLYLGNDWLYTYSDGKLQKTVETADELLQDMDKSWVVYKQYGMTASQVRSVPSEKLTELFANPNYANSEFGIIYVIKSETNVDKCSVDVHVNGSREYLDDDNVVVEVLMNGNDKKIITSEEFSKEEIEKLIDWLQRRQNGSGEIFYNIKSSEVQYLINYYMINSINIYRTADYAAKQSGQESAE